MIRTLDGKRVAGRAALARGRRVRGVADASRRAHRAAAAALAPLAAPGASDRRTVAALRRAAARYDALARASRPRPASSRPAGLSCAPRPALAAALKRLR